MANEGVDFRFRIKPVTAIAMVTIVASLGFGVGRLVLPASIKIPFFEFGANPTASPTAAPAWKETAFTDTLQYSLATKKYFLTVSSTAQAITLEMPPTLELNSLVGERILAMGLYNKNDRVLKVVDAKDMEVLPKTPIPIPTISPTASPTPSPTPIQSGPAVTPTVAPETTFSSVPSQPE